MNQRQGDPLALARRGAGPGPGYLGPKLGGPGGRGGGLRRLIARPAPARARTTSTTAPAPAGTHGGTPVFALLRGAAAGDAVGVGVGGAVATVTWNDWETTRDTPSSATSATS